MINLEIRRFLSIFLVVLVFTTGIAWATPALADNHCHKNHDKNCNHSEKNQNSSPKINCEIHIDAEDHLNNNDFGPNEQQCQNNSNNIKDSTVTQTSPGDNNGDFTSPRVVSTDPSDGDNNVPVDLSEIKVTFDESIDKNSVDTGSLSIFVNSGTGTTPDVDSVSVSGNTATFKISASIGSNIFTPGVTYTAAISSSIQDEHGNFVDCSTSNGVDDNCEWNFKASGSTASPVVSASPKGGFYNTDQSVALTCSQTCTDIFYTTDGNNPSTASTQYTGPISISATTTLKFFGENAAGNTGTIVTETYTIDKTTSPIVLLNPTSGPIGSAVNVTGKGYAPTSTIAITFDGIVVSTNPPTVTTAANGEFSASFIVPSSSIGDHTVKAAQGSNTASATFKVTSSSTSITASPPSLSESIILPNLFG